MKARHIIGFAMATLGLFIAVCTVDGSKWELALRLAAVGLTALGLGIGGWFDWQEGDEP